MLLDCVASLFEEQKSLWTPGYEWVGGQVLADESVVILYREWAPGPILGRRYVLPEFKAMFEDHLSIKDLAQIIATYEISDPTGRGEIFPVNWAAGLVPPGQRVEWTGIYPRQLPAP